MATVVDSSDPKSNYPIQYRELNYLNCSKGWKSWSVGNQNSMADFMNQGCAEVATSPVTSGGTITDHNALIFADNLRRNCNSDFSNNNDLSRLMGALQPMIIIIHSCQSAPFHCCSL